MAGLPPGSSGYTGHGRPIWCTASSRLAAAAATRAGLPVHLLLDDLAMNDRRNHDLCDELESRIRTWVAFASGDDAKLSTGALLGGPDRDVSGGARLVGRH